MSAMPCKSPENVTLNEKKPDAKDRYHTALLTRMLQPGESMGEEVGAGWLGLGLE